MTFEFEEHGDTAVVQLDGGLTGDHVDAFTRACDDRMAEGVRSFVLDLESLQSVDSDGLETLLALEERVTGRGGGLRLAHASDVIRMVLDVTRLAGRFEMHADIESAARSLR